MAILKVKRGTRVQLDTAATALGLVQGEPYLITDEGRFAVGLTNATYSSFAKQSEIQPLDADLTAIAALAGTSGLLRKTAADSWTLDTTSYLTGNQSISFTGDITGSGTTAVTTTLKNTGTAGTYTKVTTDAQGRVTAGTTLAATDIPTLTAAKISDFQTTVNATSLSSFAAPTTDLALNSKKITGLAEPTNASDAATKNYVDLSIQGLDPKASVKVATTGSNISLSAPQTIDGVSVIAGDRVLVKDQATASQNGIYIVNAGAWTRSADANTWAALTSAYVFAEMGTTNADIGFLCTVDAGGTIDVTAVTFVVFTGAGTIVAGNGLTKTGSTIDVVGTTDRISVAADSIDISTAYVGQTSITTLGTIATGTWQGAVVGIAYGGLGTTAITGLVKGTGSAYSAATEGTDYLAPSSTIDGGTF